ncbi:hypothetical protein B0H63DRAFT_526939 [Podospora didyma]|uniref:DUF4470 domain-containing protein n=1 Tax=Podospora didyma TaxID=330526 RepID=A0AAE0N6H8_9PEZI|nr:hypothetical protein B0H63DRAFT_526939 [Podospora didyma]
MDPRTVVPAREPYWQRALAEYKRGNLDQAVISLRLSALQNEAQAQAPAADDLAALSEAAFELGMYKEAAKYAVSAAHLQIDPARANKLCTRATRSYLHSLGIGLARVVATTKFLPSGEMRTKLLADLKAMDGHVRPELAVEEHPKLEEADIPPYIPVGSEAAASIFPALSRPELIFLFCGVGDGRSVFTTMADAAGAPIDPDKPEKNLKKVHFTLVDQKAASIARLLVIFGLVVEYMEAEYRPHSVHVVQKDICIALAYMYATHIYPPLVHQILQMVPERVELAMRDPDSDQAKWCYWIQIPDSSRPEILRVIQDSDCAAQRLFGGPAALSEFLWVVPPKRLLDEQQDGREGDLVPLLDAYRYSTGPDVSASANALVDYFARWVTNSTLIDREIKMGVRIPRLISAPFTLLRKSLKALRLHCGRSQGPATRAVIERLASHFGTLVNWMTALIRERDLDVELVVGEATDFMERLKFDFVEGRPARSPVRFDHIHMSNIPDTVGGLMSPLVYARPLLARPLLTTKPSSSVRFNNILGMELFPSNDHYDNEFVLMPRLECTFDNGTIFLKSALECIPDHFYMERAPESDSWLIDDAPGPEKYMVWNFKGPVKSIPFKAVIQGYETTSNDKKTRSPQWGSSVKMTIFRLVERMHQAGYPAHWLSGILSGICGGVIRSTARAPRNLLMGPGEVELLFSSTVLKRINLSPWNKEYATLLSTWRRLLPFGITTPNPTSTATACNLVSLGEIAKCTITFPPFAAGGDTLPPYSGRRPFSVHETMLVFWDNTGELDSPEDISNLRMALNDHEAPGFPLPRFRAMREGGHIHILTTFWPRKDLVDVMMDKSSSKWSVYLWRTDDYRRLSDGVTVLEAMMEEQVGWNN